MSEHIIKAEFSEVMPKIIYRLCDECYLCKSTSRCQRWIKASTEKRFYIPWMN